MTSKNKILIAIVILTAVCILGWIILSVLNTEEVLQSSSYVEMFGAESIGANVDPIEAGILENMTIDIVRISNANNNRATATMNITIPDVASAFIETIDSFTNIENVSDAVLHNRFSSNLQNHSFITVRREFEVIQQGGTWRILNKEDIDSIIDEQETELFIRLLEHSDFEPITLPTF